MSQKGKGSQASPSFFSARTRASFILFFISLLSLSQEECTVAFTPFSILSTTKTHSFSVYSATDSTAEEASQQILDETTSSSTPIFQLLASLACKTLYQSDLKRDAKGKGGGAQGSSATN